MLVRIFHRSLLVSSLSPRRLLCRASTQLSTAPAHSRYTVVDRLQSFCTAPKRLYGRGWSSAAKQPKERIRSCSERARQLHKAT